jgi:hypothetical protein
MPLLALALERSRPGILRLARLGSKDDSGWLRRSDDIPLQRIRSSNLRWVSARHCVRVGIFLSTATSENVALLGATCLKCLRIRRAAAGHVYALGVHSLTR